ncbi:malonyl-[acyl-carrier protein] O-methyltransferase BioC [Alkalilimnicola ehrlichii]|uniref:Malonyl-[acyl-carrier protein] O-methyltransferase n=1 Tax=Alkalilimnicola ehrlichii TaxID=351052 RepID=A0A3E0X4S3_9GAMM|nr:malonyl-ACP O-methyltransferase BioC [Alkalilimnicola ehrlichii]RFA31179.1 malonyl-[acyl-carrier protein] O-methyltransferase BioC [Alkalilimnicola ehrlichii]RFA39536.1 malonyl-[acyl-carrier protein] O-methyltransferase BioC [Alkalilimnicola ehrlichii]
MSELDNYRPEKAKLRDAFDRAASRYDEVAVLQREVGERLLGRLDLVTLQPERILDVGAGTGYAARALQKRYRKAEVIPLDIAPSMLRQAKRRGGFLRPLRCVCGDAEALPLASNSVDLVFSNFTLQWCHDLDRVFAEFQRVLRPGGLVMFSTLGPDTLTELRQSWSAVDDAVHVNAFIDMHDVGDALVRAHLAEPVMDVEHFTLTYDKVRDLMGDLKTLGAHNVSAGRRRGLTGKGALEKVYRAYERFRDAEGRLPATYEVVYGHGWGPDTLPQRPDATGAVRVPVSSLRRS